MPKSCIICYTQPCPKDSLGKSSDGDLSSLEGSETLKRFFELVERYLDDASENDIDSGQQGGVDKRFRIEDVIDSGLIACGGCSKIVDSFCELYHQMKTIELNINWRLWTLKNIISSAQRVPGRTKKFREDFIRNQRELNWQDWDNDNDVISEQKIDLFLGYKKEIARKCRRRLGESFPKLVIRRICPSQDESALPYPPEITLSSAVIPNDLENEFDHALSNNEVQSSLVDSDDDAIDAEEFFPIDGDDNAETEHKQPQVISGAESISLPEKDTLTGTGTESTTSRLRTVYQCPNCKKTFSSTVKLDQHQKSHEKEQQKLAEGESSEDDDREADESDYESDSTFGPTMEHFEEDDPHKLVREIHPSEDEVSAQPEVSPNHKYTDENEKSEEVENDDVDPILGPGAIKVEPNDEDDDSDSDSEMDYLEDSNESTDEALDDTSSSPSNFERSNFKTGTTKRDTKKKRDSHPPVKIIPVFSKKDWKLQYICDPSTDEHSCKLCQQSFMEIDDFQSHFNKSHATVRYKYPCCGKTFTRRDYYKNHVKEVHMGIRPRPNPVKCEQCNKSFSSKRSLRGHQRIHVGTRFKCRKCPKSYSKRQNLRHHQRNGCMGAVKVKCLVCGNYFAGRYGLIAHQRRTDCGNETGENRKYACQQCGKGCRDNSSLKKHMRAHLKSERSEGSGNKVGLGNGDVEENCFTKDDNVDEDDGSELDPTSTAPEGNGQQTKDVGMNEIEGSTSVENKKSPLSLLPVLSYISERDKFTCGLCSLDFDSKQDCQLHVKSSHNNATCKCAVCGKSYHSRYAGNRHVQAIHNKIRFKCLKCSKSFTQKDNLVKHMQGKCGQQVSRSHQCDHCGKAYLSKLDLSRHVNGVHLRAGEFVCDICGARYVRADKLKKHVNDDHLPENKKIYKYKCPICKQKFNNRVSRQRHLDQIHTGAIPRSKCETCDKSFSRSRDLRRHRHNFHAIKIKIV